MTVEELVARLQDLPPEWQKREVFDRNEMHIREVLGVEDSGFRRVVLQ